MNWEPTLYDLQNGIKTITGLFPEAICLTGEENEAFVIRLYQIVGKMQTLGINPSHRPSVLFALLADQARLNCKHLQLSTIYLDEMIDTVKKKGIFDVVIKDRRITR